MNLRHLTDKVLLEDTKNLVSKEKQITVQILFHLSEIDRRKLFSDLKYPSMYEYCIKELKYSEGSAHNRIVSARLLFEIPEIQEKIQNGALSLVNITTAVKYMRDNLIKEVGEKKKILSQIENLSKKECEIKLLELTGRQKPSVTTITILNETFSLLQQTRDLLGGYLTNDQLLEKIAKDEIEKIEKARFKMHSKGRKSPQPVEVTCVIPAETQRNVYDRDEKRCVRCGSIINLQKDHTKPKSLGGSNDADNVRLLCFNCNQRARIEAKL